LALLQDTVAVQELRFGDNDTLSAQVATLVEADYLFLMTDVDALYTANPKVSGRMVQQFDSSC
jgi:glutamate 5-kinase